MAGPPVWAVGQILTATDVNQWLLPAAVVKTSDEAVASSTTMQNDNDLHLAVGANAWYAVSLYLSYEGGTGGSSDLKLGWANPAGSVMRWWAGGMSGPSNSPTSGNTYAGADNVAFRTQGAGNLCGLYVYGTIQVTATAGTVQVQWAQNVSLGTATTIHPGSVLMLQRIA